MYPCVAGQAVTEIVVDEIFTVTVVLTGIRCTFIYVCNKTAEAANPNSSQNE